MKIIDWIVGIARLIVKGREIGLYNEEDGIQKKQTKHDRPARPGRKR